MPDGLNCKKQSRSRELILLRTKHDENNIWWYNRLVPPPFGTWQRLQSYFEYGCRLLILLLRRYPRRIPIIQWCLVANHEKLATVSASWQNPLILVSMAYSSRENNHSFPYMHMAYMRMIHVCYSKVWTWEQNSHKFIVD